MGPFLERSGAVLGDILGDWREGWWGHSWNTGWGDVRGLTKKLTLVRKVDAAAQRSFTARRPALRGARVKMIERHSDMSVRHRKERMPGELPGLCLGRLPDLCCAAVRSRRQSGRGSTNVFHTQRLTHPSSFFR